MKMATLCYLMRDDEVLMLHRVKKQNDFHQGKWNGLGGKFEAGETPEECAKREIKEESGLDVKTLVPCGVITFPMFDMVEDWYAFVFTSNNFTGELIDSLEGDLHWKKRSELLKLNLWPGDKIFIPWILENKKFSAKFIYENKKFIDYRVDFYNSNH